MAKKKVRIQFFDLPEDQKSVLKAYIDGLGSESVAHAGEIHFQDERRKSVRVSINLNDVSTQSAKTQSVPSQNFFCDVLELSADGMCVAIPPEVKLVKNSLVFFVLHFLEPEQLVRGRILGVKK